MKPITLSVTGVGSSSPIIINTNVTPIAVGFVAVVSGTVSSFTIQYSMDDPNSSTGLTNWFATSISGASATTSGNITYPITALRATIATGSGTVTLTATQAGIA
jgi:hypothetical protein